MPHASAALYTPANVERAQMLWNAGRTTQAICAEIGITDRQLRRWRERHPFRQRVNQHDRGPAPVRQAGLAMPSEAPDASDLPRAAVPGTGCMFPLWPHRAERPTFVYCDAVRSAGQSYCEAHRLLCYTPRQTGRTMETVSV